MEITERSVKYVHCQLRRQQYDVSDVDLMSLLLTLDKSCTLF